MLLALFRRDFTDDKSGQVIPRGLIAPLSKTVFAWTPRQTAIAGIATILTILGFYLYREYRILMGPPTLVVHTPKPDEEIKGERVEIVGRSEPETEVTVNGEKVILMTDGSFRYSLDLPAGENLLVIEATDARGRTSRVSQTVQMIY